MPLRDHFRPPIANQSSWEGFHAMWPATIVQALARVLPDDYVAEPRVHLGPYFEVDVCTFEHRDSTSGTTDKVPTGQSSLPSASATLQPTLVLDADPTSQYEYEVLVFDQQRGRHLVAAIELVSPANKDRPESRQAFVAKCSALLQQRVCVSIVDPVTTKNFNLYCELLDALGESDPMFPPPPSAIYAVTCRGRRVAEQPRFEVWAYPLVMGQNLPVLPIWIADDMAVPLDLETTYEATCQSLRLA